MRRVPQRLTALVDRARIWRSISRQSNFWLSTKCGAGTVIDFIGGRMVLNGGYGCVPPVKQARAICDTMTALEGVISRERLEAHNSFLVHVGEWLDFPTGTLKGLSAPLKLPGTAEQPATISDAVKAILRVVLNLLQSRSAASFWSGIEEAGQRRKDGIVGCEGVTFAPRLTSDACSDVERPHICGVAGGLYFRFELSGERRNRHITLTEGCGSVLCLIIFPKYFPKLQLLLEADATAALATVTASASAEDLIYLKRRAEEEPSYREATLRTWATHCSGWANALSDAGSPTRWRPCAG